MLRTPVLIRWRPIMIIVKGDPAAGTSSIYILHDKELPAHILRESEFTVDVLMDVSNSIGSRLRSLIACQEGNDYYA
jgi:hypothetical protein